MYIITEKKQMGQAADQVKKRINELENRPDDII